MNISTELVVPGRFDQQLDRADLAAASYLARYAGTTRRNYQSDLLQWFRWCAAHDLGVLSVHRAQIEVWAREMEEVRQLARSTVGRRLATVAGFYRFAQISMESKSSRSKRPDRGVIKVLLVPPSRRGGRSSDD